MYIYIYLYMYIYRTPTVEWSDETCAVNPNPPVITRLAAASHRCGRTCSFTIHMCII